MDNRHRSIYTSNLLSVAYFRWFFLMETPAWTGTSKGTPSETKHFLQLITVRAGCFKGCDGLFSQTTAHFPLQILSDKERPLTTPALETDTTQPHFKLSPALPKHLPDGLNHTFPHPSFRSCLTPLQCYSPILQFLLLFPWDCAKTAPF